MGAPRKFNRTRVYIPSQGPMSWQAFLAEPVRQWRTGYSAKTVAHCWESANGLPDEIAHMFDGSAELLVALPEHKVPLDGGNRDSQNDLFALIRFGDQTCAATVEGKVSEPFGPTVGEWYAEPSQGKRERMRQLCDLLGFDDVPPFHIRYQLMHRTASALIEARRFKTDEAAMIVHSFSAARMWFEDFATFARLFGAEVSPDLSSMVVLKSGQRLRLGWATGDEDFLKC
ncbi:MAG: hypothetical protein E5X49_04305 [Mesorhizobium sp.]|nr:MAG: hypothetical protein EOQ70_05105 [Mesorhizobium sp.]RWK21816.1 MAG: hypothetical protein EOR41_03125 [Mesorhizobium sp.]RWK25661.1 MAG: hypothetical protein EOR43_04155 [Mesorhizobium sp.]RWK35883.1 MAG: hypothetical protein EOR44_04110 [Mesorhizobium sp.]TIQ45536.1 MAG: hypothetical protein E5X49_04305 [Mesorhizobium sp.]